MTRTGGKARSARVGGEAVVSRAAIAVTSRDATPGVREEWLISVFMKARAKRSISLWRFALVECAVAW